MNKRRIALWTVILLIAAFLFWKIHQSHFDWHAFWLASRQVNLPLFLLATLMVYSNSVARAVRWTLFLKPSLPPEERKPWWTLLGAQFIGFAGLAIFGRVGELIRPYLVSRRIGLSFSSQIAVVAVERIFDLAAFGILFAGNLILSPQLNALPYHELFHKLGWVIAAMIAVLAAFVVAVRMAGEFMARLIRHIVGILSKPAGQSAEAKVLEFRNGLNVVGSTSDFIGMIVCSFALWGTIAITYVLTMKAFPAPVHNLTIAHCLLLMGFSAVGGIVTLPGVGGGAQALTFGALTRLFGVPAELAASVAIITYFVTSINVILPGLIYARVESVNLRTVARESAQKS
ncbi:lysylphosphatidylglycerol synthase transmembrane domain-containing protein [Terriglobus sp. RCC_193]|uniref:lysylphosphatidylglycerol synthase transmembrane domain-containing protein n=1 Tax=Terriglobus sp. RCC_193 TaxID=3239218 RepID=UPI003524DFA7